MIELTILFIFFRLPQIWCKLSIIISGDHKHNEIRSKINFLVSNSNKDSSTCFVSFLIKDGV